MINIVANTISSKNLPTQKNKLNGSIYPMTNYSEEQMMPASQDTSL